MKVRREDLPDDIRAALDSFLETAKARGVHGNVTIEKTGGYGTAYWVVIHIPADGESEPRGGHSTP